MYPCPSSLSPGCRQSWSAGWVTVSESWPLVLPVQAAQSMQLCDRVEPVWKSTPNATGASCPQVNYTHWHWGNWLTWLWDCCMTLKWGRGLGEGQSKPKVYGSSLTYNQLVFIRCFICVVQWARSWWVMRIRWFTNLYRVKMTTEKRCQQVAKT